ncbi:MAG: carbohydrate binding family 9 domain-containing protein [Ignavibacteriaceae bacterium]|nr:carbohydrate binding family 9 domain-containing protein [Ignavibacteriaceae bacterium]
MNKDVILIAEKLNSPIELDGELIEHVWQNGNTFENFIQRDPDEGAPASERTIMKIAYDKDYLYLGAIMYDSSPELILARLTRRDEDIDADNIVLCLDPYNDKRSGYYFGLNAAGTQLDGILYNDTWDDDSWDGVWEGKVHRNNKGWSAEMKIPFSQMRFNESDSMVWGINFRRIIARKNEESYLVFVPEK